ncbi:hypothetical protein [Streptomyces sp. VRA16 Mangrove soil]|uniref:DUF7144 family membrane protein n=1 Tax=Streptomyces sp. VRA16 Mangrove soil TaxID=2817434 RepID=UPI001A9CCC9B|nr:hypothetical protein [Streptomyces sp. VRA16 Mangrove soil]MBO1332133.1 hypothetical protein [Streptomyces sp. VRA16 Mangrove soil]
MAGQISPDHPPGSGAPEQEPHVSVMGLGGVVFAACVLGVIGGFHAIAGLSEILNDNYYQAQNDYAYDFDTNVRGWIEMITGVVMFGAALCLFSGRTWARIVGMAVAALSALQNFFFTPYHPVWSAIIIILDVLVIWSLATYGRREAHKVYGAPM